MARAIPERFFPLIKKFEDDILRVYDDKQPWKILGVHDLVQGVLTAGCGHTAPDLYIGMTVTQAMSDKWLAEDAKHKAAEPLAAKIGLVVDELTENQYTALLAFVFNLGTGDPKKPEWTIWVRLRERAWDQIPPQFMKFIFWNGKRSEGLYRRRAAEVAIWGEGEPNVDRQSVPSSVTRREATPPVPLDPVPASRSPTVLATVGSAVAGGPVLINSLATQAESYAAATNHARTAMGPLVVLFSSLGALPRPIVIALALATIGLIGFSIYRVLRDKSRARH